MNQFRPASPFSMPPVVKNLIMINIVMLVATWALQSFGIDLTEKLGLYYIGSPHFRPYQFITHLFMHGNFMHLFLNMFALYMFGKILEMVWGPRRFLIYFFVTGIGAAILHSLVTYIEMSSMQHAANAFYNTPSPELLSKFVKTYFGHQVPQITDLINTWYDSPNNPALIQKGTEIVQEISDVKINIPTVGASGAVFGILLAFGYLFPNTQLFLLFPPIPIRAKYFVIGYGAIELYSAFTQSNSGVAHFAHLGGMLFGFLLLKYWGKNSQNFY
jgi:membrane associated rhomboid family serine protease